MQTRPENLPIVIDPAKLTPKEQRMLWYLLANHARRSFLANTRYSFHIPPAPNREPATFAVTLAEPMVVTVCAVNPCEKKDAALVTQLINNHIIPKQQDFLHINSLYTLPQMAAPGYTFFSVKFTIIRYHAKKLAVIDNNHFARGGISTLHHQLGRLIWNEKKNTFDFKRKKAHKVKVFKLVYGNQGVQSAIRESAERLVNKEVDFTSRFEENKVAGPCYDRANDEAGFFMRMLPGTDLFNQLVSPIPILTLYQKLCIALLLCENLARIHSKNIIHRDIKPENIRVVIDAQNNVESAFHYDFNLSKDKNQDDRGERTGTLPYASPEGLQGQGQTEESDIYSLCRAIRDLFDPTFTETLQSANILYGNPVSPRFFLNCHTSDNKNMDDEDGGKLVPLLNRGNNTAPERRPSTQDAADVFKQLVNKYRPAIEQPPAPAAEPRLSRKRRGN